MKWLLIPSSTIEFRIERELYDESVIYKCFYWYGGEFVVDISCTENVFVVSLKKRTGIIDQQAAEAFVDKVKTDLLDFKTRQQVWNETSDIARVLIAKAFTAGDEFDFNPPGSLSEFQNNG